MTVTISARGQMVIPVSIRNRYGIRSRSKVELLDLGNEIVIVPVEGYSPSKSRGILKGVSTSDLIKERRRDRERENS